jgi:hypothetical protein
MSIRNLNALKGSSKTPEKKIFNLKNKKGLVRKNPTNSAFLY